MATTYRRPSLSATARERASDRSATRSCRSSGSVPAGSTGRRTPETRLTEAAQERALDGRVFRRSPAAMNSASSFVISGCAAGVSRYPTTRPGRAAGRARRSRRTPHASRNWRWSTPSAAPTRSAPGRGPPSSIELPFARSARGNQRLIAITPLDQSPTARHRAPADSRIATQTSRRTA